MDDFLTNFVSEKIQEAATVALLAAHDVQVKLEQLPDMNKPVAVKQKITRLTKPSTSKLSISSSFTSKPLVSIIMTYFNRKTQTKLTFDNFEKMYAGKYNIEVIIVDDSSREDENLQTMIHNYSFRIKLVELKEKHWSLTGQLSRPPTGPCGALL